MLLSGPQPHSRERVYPASYQYPRLGHWSHAKTKVVSHIARVGGVSALGQVPPSRVTDCLSFLVLTGTPRLNFFAFSWSL